MCDTTKDYATHISTECATGGSGQCDGYCATHPHTECTCSCHTAWDLPETVVEVLVWHDDLNGVVASFDKGDTTERWEAAMVAIEDIRKALPNQEFAILVGQNRIVIAERY